MTMLRTVLVDDEPLAIRGLELRLAAFADVEVIATCRNGREAIKTIRTLKPDLVFLDIQMPGFDGFGVIQGVMEASPPLIVFVTAYDDHAVRAFEAQAFDYLLKPVEEGRLAQTLQRARTALSAQRAAAGDGSLAAQQAVREGTSAPITPAGPLPTQFERLLNIRDRGQIFRIEIDSIEKIEAAGDYMCIHVNGQTLILRETMKDLERRLDPRKFQRVHRSTIVNLDLVKQVKPHTNGECFLVLSSGAQIKVSRSYREVVARFV
jgi:two-component system, LytTR family, response regulator